LAVDAEHPPLSELVDGDFRTDIFVQLKGTKERAARAPAVVSQEPGTAESTEDHQRLRRVQCHFANQVPGLFKTLSGALVLLPLLLEQAEIEERGGPRLFATFSSRTSQAWL
jgi:hypothetical protein